MIQESKCIIVIMDGVKNYAGLEEGASRGERAVSLITDNLKQTELSSCCSRVILFFLFSFSLD